MVLGDWFSFLVFFACLSLSCFFEMRVHSNKQKNYLTGSVLASQVDLPDPWVEGHHIL